jgi:hypothetical protein
MAQHQAQPYTQAWREFGQHWPNTIPLRLQEYCDHHGVKLNIIDIDSEWPSDAFYPVGLGFFDFGIDYFELMPERIRTGLFFDHVRVLFYYHEGDNPFHIKTRLDELCIKHNLKNNCYRFVSANTAAKKLKNFVYFTDFELWYYQRNRASPALKIYTRPRERDFTVLNRLHKSWRALAMADITHNGILDNSYWSYCETGEFVDQDCAIEIDAIAGTASSAPTNKTANVLEDAAVLSGNYMINCSFTGLSYDVSKTTLIRDNSINMRSNYVPVIATYDKPLIQTGLDTTSANPTITFATAYLTAPRVYCQASENTPTQIESVEIYNVTTTQFTMRKKYFDGASISTKNYSVNWMVVGTIA